LSGGGAPEDALLKLSGGGGMGMSGLNGASMFSDIAEGGKIHIFKGLNIKINFQFFKIVSALKKLKINKLKNPIIFFLNS